MEVESGLMAKTITELTPAGAVNGATDLLWIEQGGAPFKITPDTLAAAHTHAAADIVSGTLAPARLRGTTHGVTAASNFVEYNRFGSSFDLETIREPGQYGTGSGNLNGPTGGSFDPLWQGASSNDVSSLLVVPRTASRALAWRGETADVFTAWHYGAWTLTAGLSDLTLYPRKAENAVITGAWEHHHAVFGQFTIDRLSATGSASIRYQNNDGIKGYAGFNDAEQFGTFNSVAGASGFTVSATGQIVATSYGGILEANLLSKIATETISGEYTYTAQTHYNDNVVANYGTGNDLQIFFDITNSIIRSVGASNALRLQVNTSEVAIACNPNAGVDLHYNGVRAMSVKNHAIADDITGAEVRHFDGSYYDVGLAVMPAVTKSSAITISETHQHKTIRITNVTGSITFANDADMAVDSVGWIINTTTSNQTLAATSDNLEVFSGDAVANATGNMTLAGKGWCTWRKLSDTEYELVGLGLS